MKLRPGEVVVRLDLGMPYLGTQHFGGSRFDCRHQSLVREMAVAHRGLVVGMTENSPNSV